VYFLTESQIICLRQTILTRSQSIIIFELIMNRKRNIIRLHELEIPSLVIISVVAGGELCRSESAIVGIHSDMSPNMSLKVNLLKKYKSSEFTLVIGNMVELSASQMKSMPRISTVRFIASWKGTRVAFESAALPDFYLASLKPCFRDCFLQGRAGPSNSVHNRCL
jgi:hypothetical protein